MARDGLPPNVVAAVEALGTTIDTCAAVSGKLAGINLSGLSLTGAGGNTLHEQGGMQVVGDMSKGPDIRSV